MPNRELTEEEKKIVAETVKIGLEMQRRFRPEPLYKLTGKGYMQSEGVAELARLKEEALTLTVGVDTTSASVAP